MNDAIEPLTETQERALRMHVLVDSPHASVPNKSVRRLLASLDEARARPQLPLHFVGFLVGQFMKNKMAKDVIDAQMRARVIRDSWNRQQKDKGQVLVLFALMLTVMVGMAALVVDVGWKMSTERRLQATADAASLAGAQELQAGVSRTAPNAAMYAEARSEALKVVVEEMAPGVVPTCATSADIVDCPVGNFEVSIKTPSPNCVSCTPQRAVQVSVIDPKFSTSFARLFGQTEWRLTRTSVAGLTFGKSYTIVTLRPPMPHGSSSSIDIRDIRIDGGTRVNVFNGDVGTNSNMNYAGINSLLAVQPGYGMYYFDSGPPDWGTNPVGTHIASLIADPNYPIPAAPTTAFPNSNAGKDTEANCQTIVTTKILTHTPYVAYVPGGTTPDMTKINCYKPGTYSQKLTDGNGELTVLEPGLYYFTQGLDIQSSLIGGYEANQPGVALVFPQTELFKQRNGMVALNAGTRFEDTSGAEAAAAETVTGTPITTTTTPPLKMTVIVQRDTNCVVALPYNTACNDNHNETLDLAGSAALYLAGVQYAPSDNSKISGGSNGTGYVGQIIAWTLFYTGSTAINQEGYSVESPGIMRIDTACSPGTVCN